jgi:isopenicillin N synthase-like dioxygenase
MEPLLTIAFFALLLTKVATLGVILGYLAITWRTMAFTEVPVLDLSEARSESTKPFFLQQLREALLNVGFLYIKNTGIDQRLFDRVCDEGIAFFDLSDHDKLQIEMKNQSSFLGYSKVGIANHDSENITHWW